MYRVMVAGAGKIGSLVAGLLADSQDYEVHLADVAFEGTDVTRVLQVMPSIKTVALDVQDQDSTEAYLKKHDINAVISCMPYFLNEPVARAAKKVKAHYFDITEDRAVAGLVKALALNAETAFVPQCGLAPGFVSIAAHSLMQEFDACHHAKLRVGALPQRTSNALHYALTWSTDGLINEYGNACHGIEKGVVTAFAPLEGLESLRIDGCEYEAFNTSGGLGNLEALYHTKIQSLNYKTIRYPGHCEKMRFLMNDLNLNHDRETLKRLLEKAIPNTVQDMVIVYVTVEGIQQGVFTEKSYIKKIVPVTIHGLTWSAIQISTAAGVCAVVDLVLTHSNTFHGLVLQETFGLADLLGNRFGHYYA